MFCVVEFTNTKEVEVIPKLWLLEDDKMCWWPNFRSDSKIRNMIAKCDPPHPSSFLKYNVRVLKCYSSLKIARENAREALYHSDLNSEAEASPRRRRTANQKRNYDELSSDEDQERVPSLMLVVPPPPVSESNSVEEVNIASDDKRPRIEAGNDINPSTSTSAQSIPSTSTQVNGDGEISRLSEPQGRLNSDDGTLCMSSSKFQAWVVRNMGILKAQMKQVQDTLDVMLHKSNCGIDSATALQVDEEPLHGYLPVSDDGSLATMEEKLTDVHFRKKLVSRLSQGGGNGLGNVTRRILSSVLTDEMALCMSWKGTRGHKRAFIGTKLKDVVLESVRKSKKMAETDESSIENVIKDWLKNSKKRISVKEKKSTHAEVNS